MSTPSTQGFKSFSTQSLVEHAVEGVPLKFAPCTMATIMAFQPTIAQCWKALDVLTRNEFTDRASEAEEIRGTDGATVKRQINPAATPEFVRLRTETRGRAINELSATLSSPDTRAALGGMILNSLRFDSDGMRLLSQDIPSFNVAAPGAFFDALTPTWLAGALTGMWKANAGAFGPLGEKVVAAAKAATARVANRAESNLGLTEPMTPNEPPIEPTSTTSSSNSKTT